MVAIGEGAHFNSESYRLRHRLFRYLVERHGFSAYAMESGFAESRRVNDWIHGRLDPGRIGDVLANGLTSLMGMCREQREQLEWMRRTNASGERRVAFYGIDQPGSNLSLLPGLDLVIEYLATADPDFTVDPELREIAASFAASSNFTAVQAFEVYSGLGQDRKDRLTAGLAALYARMRVNRPDHVRRTDPQAHDVALHALATVVAENLFSRDMTVNVRDRVQADTVEWVLEREDRVVLAAHNAHVQRWPSEFPGTLPRMISAGQHLGDRLGSDYLVIGTTQGSGRTLTSGQQFFDGQLFEELPPPGPGTLDGLLDASHDGPFAVDLRRLDPADAELVSGTRLLRSGPYECPVDPITGFDVLIHLPHVTEVTFDPEAIAAAPAEVASALTAGTDGS